MREFKNENKKIKNSFGFVIICVRILNVWLNQFYSTRYLKFIK